MTALPDSYSSSFVPEGSSRRKPQTLKNEIEPSAEEINPLSLPEEFKNLSVFPVLDHTQAQPHPDISLDAHQLSEQEVALFNRLDAVRLTNVRYLVINKNFDKGGMGSIHEAFDLQQRRLVMFKFVSSDLRDNAPEDHATSYRLRFEHEALTMSHIGSENSYIVPVLDFIEHPTKGLALIMQRMDPEDQPSILDLLKKTPLPWTEVLRIVNEVGNVCDFMWSYYEIFHRDLKPGNFFINKGTGHVKVSDFGLASGFTDNDLVAGTLLFSSPERVATGETTIASEVFSMAVNTYFFITQKYLFDPDRRGNNAQIWRDIENLDPDRVAFELQMNVAPALRRQNIPEQNIRNITAVLIKALQKNPELRYQSVTEFADELRKATGLSKENLRDYQPQFSSFRAAPPVPSVDDIPHFVDDKAPTNDSRGDAPKKGKFSQFVRKFL